MIKIVVLIVLFISIYGSTHDAMAGTGEDITHIGAIELEFNEEFTLKPYSTTTRIGTIGNTIRCTFTTDSESNERVISGGPFEVGAFSRQYIPTLHEDKSNLGLYRYEAPVLNSTILKSIICSRFFYKNLPANQLPSLARSEGMITLTQLERIMSQKDILIKTK